MTRGSRDAVDFYVNAITLKIYEFAVSADVSSADILVHSAYLYSSEKVDAKVRQILHDTLD